MYNNRNLMAKSRNEEIDDEFALVVVSNQVHFYRSGYRFKHFTFQDPKNENNPFSANVHKYINRVVESRLELYKHALRYIELFHINKVIGTRFFNLLENVCRKFYNKEYSHENLMIACADMCTFTRCAFVKGLTSSYWPRYLLAEVILYTRMKNSFSDLSYQSLNEWLSNQLANNEEYVWPEHLDPVKLSLEWINRPLSSNKSSTLLGDSPSSASRNSSSPLPDETDENVAEGGRDNLAIANKERKSATSDDLKTKKDLESD